jgi:hypothetical protein
MNMKYAIPALSLFTLSCFPVQAQANLVSTFTSGDEGWHAVDPTGDYTSSWQSSGYLLGVETNPQGGDGYFIAPSNWLGNWSAYAGGTISYDINVIQGTSTNWFSDPDVRILSGATEVTWTSNINPVGHDWVTIQVALTPANFGPNLATVLSNVTAFKIRGELINYEEKEGFDNVRLTAAVPEPESYATLLAGLGLLGFFARWRKRRSGGPSRRMPA